MAFRAMGSEAHKQTQSEMALQLQQQQQQQNIHVMKYICHHRRNKANRAH